MPGLLCCFSPKNRLLVDNSPNNVKGLQGESLGNVSDGARTNLTSTSSSPHKAGQLSLAERMAKVQHDLATAEEALSAMRAMQARGSDSDAGAATEGDASALATSLRVSIPAHFNGSGRLTPARSTDMPEGVVSVRSSRFSRMSSNASARSAEVEAVLNDTEGQAKERAGAQAQFQEAIAGVARTIEMLEKAIAHGKYCDELGSLSPQMRDRLSSHTHSPSAMASFNPIFCPDSPIPGTPGHSSPRQYPRTRSESGAASPFRRGVRGMMQRSEEGDVAAAQRVHTFARGIEVPPLSPSGLELVMEGSEMDQLSGTLQQLSKPQHLEECAQEEATNTAPAAAPVALDVVPPSDSRQQPQSLGQSQPQSSSDPNCGSVDQPHHQQQHATLSSSIAAAGDGLLLASPPAPPPAPPPTDCSLTASLKRRLDELTSERDCRHTLLARQKKLVEQVTGLVTAAATATPSLLAVGSTSLGVKAARPAHAVPAAAVAAALSQATAVAERAVQSCVRWDEKAELSKPKVNPPDAQGHQEVSADTEAQGSEVLALQQRVSDVEAECTVLAAQLRGQCVVLGKLQEALQGAARGPEGPAAGHEDMVGEVEGCVETEGDVGTGNRAGSKEEDGEPQPQYSGGGGGGNEPAKEAVGAGKQDVAAALGAVQDSGPAQVLVGELPAVTRLTHVSADAGEGEGEGGGVP